MVDYRSTKSTVKFEITGFQGRARSAQRDAIKGGFALVLFSSVTLLDFPPDELARN